MINRTNTVLAVLLVAVVVMTAVVGVDYSKPNIEILPDMKYTPAWEAFAANPNFPNGQTMQPPVPGTIARGPMPLYYSATKEDAARAGEELDNPYSLAAIAAAVAADREAVPLDAASSGSETTQQTEAAVRDAIVRDRYAASLERGDKVYRTICVSCHGAKGAGDGPVTQRGFPPPPSMLTGKSLQMKDGQLFHLLTYGQGSMEPLAAQLSRELRWDVINYVRDLQSKAPLGANATSGSAAEAQPTGEQSYDEQDVEDIKEAKPEKDESASPPNELRDRSSDRAP